MDGLAQQMAGQGRGMRQQQQGGGQMPTLGEVIQLLVQGADPQELLSMGIPEELLMQALQVIEQQMAQQQQAAPAGAEQGLAQAMVQ